MSDTILRQKAYEMIDSGTLFDLEFVTADRRRGTGGKLILVKQWMKSNKTAMPEHMPADVLMPKGALSKNPNHRKNKTFVICHPNNRMINPITIHYRLMQVLNGKRIIS